MTISDIITKNYILLKSCCHNDDKVISMSRTSEDILQDICLTALKKYKGTNITEEEGLTYLKKQLFAELHFQEGRLKNEIITYMDNLEGLGV